MVDEFAEFGDLELDDPAIFADRCCMIYDSEASRWIPFGLWPEQKRAMAFLANNKQTIALKARQLGFTWLALAYALHQMCFKPAATVMLFSVGEREAKEALGFRFRGMYDRLPDWMRVQTQLIGKPGVEKIEFSNGSRIMAFPASAGVSYTATLAIVDEADKGEVDNLGKIMENVKPTIDAGGQLVILSTINKSRPLSLYKGIVRAALAGRSSFRAIFLPWSARPGRTQAWYDREFADQEAARGSADAAADYMGQEYPATAEEALAPAAAGARIPPLWLKQCYQELDLLPPVPPDAPSIPGLVIYRLPERDPTRNRVRYVVGGDPAKGNPHSDDSAGHVLRVDTGEEVAAFAGKHEMAVFGRYLDLLGTWYNGADLMVERNSLGEATLLWLREHSRLQVLNGLDGHPGWHTSEKSKAMLYASAADAFRNKETTIHSSATYMQLASIEGETLSAPPPLHDDRAMSFVLALQGVLQIVKRGPVQVGLTAAMKRGLEKDIFKDMPSLDPRMGGRTSSEHERHMRMRRRMGIED